MEPTKKYIMKWGRYKGETLSFIKNNNAKYTKWLLTNPEVREKCPKLVAVLKQL